MEQQYNNIAMLIDADNANINYIQSIIEKVNTFGRISVKRVYGNWKKEQLKKWEEIVKKFALNPVQQFDYVKGKNTTDIALVIDAMELLNDSKYDAFVIVSSDSDYTPLCIKLRERGLFIIGAGNDDAKESFKQSCDVYIDINQLERAASKKNAVKVNNKASKAEEKIKDEEEKLHELLKNSAENEDWQVENGYVNLASAGSYIKRVQPDFDIRKYGAKSFMDYLKQHSDLYETKIEGKVVLFKCR